VTRTSAPAATLSNERFSRTRIAIWHRARGGFI
jgi:hypothetical protein